VQLCKNPIFGSQNSYIFSKGEKYLFSMGTRVSGEDGLIDEHSKIKLRAALQKPDFRYPEFLYF
jgi:hypothetical protein